MKNEHQLTTRGIVNKGFSGLRGIFSRFNFGNGGQERSPLALTNHTANRYRQVELRPKPGNKAYKKFFDNPEMASFEGFGRPTIFKTITRRLNYRELNHKRLVLSGD